MEVLDCPHSQALVSERTKRTLVHRFCTVGISVKFGNLCKICSVTVTSARQLSTSCERCLQLSTVYVNDDKGTVKAISSLLIYWLIHSSQMLTHMTDATFPFEVYRFSWTKQCRQLRTIKMILFLMWNLPKSVSQATLQCGLSEVNRNFLTWRMRKHSLIPRLSCVDGG